MGSKKQASSLAFADAQVDEALASSTNLILTRFFYFCKRDDIIKCMVLILGLGNPGPKYKFTRHNIGFIVLDKFAKKNEFPNWEKSKKINCLYAWGLIVNKEIELVKPLTYMNNSGKAAKYVTKKHNLSAENIFVVHDDIDLPLGKIRISRGRGAAGHKGVESIIKEIGTKNFVRFRIGIQPKFGKPKNPEKFVLQKFNKEEEKIVKELVKKTVEAIEITLRKGLGVAMNEFNK